MRHNAGHSNAGHMYRSAYVQLHITTWLIVIIAWEWTITLFKRFLISNQTYLLCNWHDEFSLGANFCHNEAELFYETLFKFDTTAISHDISFYIFRTTDNFKKVLL